MCGAAHTLQEACWDCHSRTLHKGEFLPDMGLLVRDERVIPGVMFRMALGSSPGYLLGGTHQ
jgi:hypothetical protein